MNLLGDFATQEEYDKCEKHWRTTFEYVLKTCPEHSFWDVQPRAKFGNGEEMCDGNPILMAICDERKLGIRIIQVRHDGRTNVVHWEDKFGDNDEYAELVVALPMDEEAVLDGIELMREWIRRDHSANN